MTTVARNSPVVLAPVGAVNSVDLVDELWSSDRSGIAMLDNGATDSERIIAAAGAVESLEWELDRARSELASVIERAVSNGCSIEKVAESAEMTREDIATLLWVARAEQTASLPGL